MCFKRFNLFLLFFFLRIFTVDSQEYFTKESIVLNILSSPADPKLKREIIKNIHKGSQKQIEASIIHYLYSQGYISAAVDSVKKDEGLLSLWVNPGAIYRWKRLDFAPDVVEALRTAGIHPEALSDMDFSLSRLNFLFETVLHFYENNGYPFVEVKLDSIKIEGDDLQAVMIADKKELVAVDTVIVKGNVDISRFYIYNVIGIHPQDKYNESLIKTVSDRINNTEFLTMKKPPLLKFDKTYAELVLDIKEKKANTFDGIVGFYSDALTGKLSLNGNFKLKLVNSFKTGESFLLNWQSPGQGNQKLNISYSQPYIFKSGFGFDYIFDLYRQDSSFLNITNKPLAAYRFSPDKYISALATFHSSVLISGNTDSSRHDFSSATFGVGFGYNTLDYKMNPRRGFVLEGSLEAGNKNIPAKDGETEKKNYKQGKAMGFFSGKWFLPLFKNSAIMFSNESALILSESIFDNELFRIGGLKLLRGFDEQSIWCSSYSVFDFEYRLLLGRNSNLVLFYNFAYVEKKIPTSFTKDYPSGFGAGINFDTGAGVMSLFYALGKQQNNSLNFRTSKIHFGYMVKF